jgi:hypothetical protein
MATSISDFFKKIVQILQPDEFRIVSTAICIF